MFARVITAQAGTEGFDNAIRLAQQQLPSARQQPGFQGFYLLTDVETGKLITISLWETREQMEAVGRGTAAGIHDQSAAAMGLTAPSLEPTKSRCRAEPPRSGASPGVLQNQASRCGRSDQRMAPT
jgi:heme-degrading monooxygenase HmoA